jgi:hypothetical protein
MKICSLVLLILCTSVAGRALGTGQWNDISILNAILALYWAFVVWGYMKEGSDGR